MRNSKSRRRDYVEILDRVERERERKFKSRDPSLVTWPPPPPPFPSQVDFSEICPRYLTSNRFGIEIRKLSHKKKTGPTTVRSNSLVAARPPITRPFRLLLSRSERSRRSCIRANVTPHLEIPTTYMCNRVDRG